MVAAIGRRDRDMTVKTVTVRSMILINIGVIDIGGKSTFCLGTATLGIGRMLACFHCCGTAGTAIEKLNSVVMCLENTGAPTRRNQAGSPSRPVAVGHYVRLLGPTGQSDDQSRCSVGGIIIS